MTAAFSIGLPLTEVDPAWLTPVSSPLPITPPAVTDWTVVAGDLPPGHGLDTFPSLLLLFDQLVRDTGSREGASANTGQRDLFSTQGHKPRLGRALVPSDLPAESTVEEKPADLQMDTAVALLPILFPAAQPEAPPDWTASLLPPQLPGVRAASNGGGCCEGADEIERELGLDPAPVSHASPSLPFTGGAARDPDRLPKQSFGGERKTPFLDDSPESGVPDPGPSVESVSEPEVDSLERTSKTAAPPAPVPQLVLSEPPKAAEAPAGLPLMAAPDQSQTVPQTVRGRGPERALGTGPQPDPTPPPSRDVAFEVGLRQAEPEPPAGGLSHPSAPVPPKEAAARKEPAAWRDWVSASSTEPATALRAVSSIRVTAAPPTDLKWAGSGQPHREAVSALDRPAPPEQIRDFSGRNGEPGTPVQPEASDGETPPEGLTDSERRRSTAGTDHGRARSEAIRVDWEEQPIRGLPQNPKEEKSHTPAGFSVPNEARNGESAQSVRPPPPIRHVALPPEPLGPRNGEVSHLRLDLREATGSDLQLRFSERAGRINVVVNSADPDTRQVLRTNLNDLVRTLESSGFSVEPRLPEVRMESRADFGVPQRGDRDTVRHEAAISANWAPDQDFAHEHGRHPLWDEPKPRKRAGTASWNRVMEEIAWQTRSRLK